MTREEILKVAKPILFNTDMVRAILDGRKTVTRRVVKTPTENVEKWFKQGILKPPYQPGDILYVRESVFQGVGHYLDVSGETVCFLTNDFEYYADGLHEKDHWKDKHEHTWMHRRPSIHMPKEAARIWLKVKDVRVERLQEMNEVDTAKEGIRTDVQTHRLDDFDFIENFGGKELFKNLWNSTIKKSDIDRYGWDASPWVWVIEFERIE